jgi:hypothetical protein
MIAPAAWACPPKPWRRRAGLAIVAPAPGIVITPWSVALAADGKTLYGSIVEREADIWIVEIK